MAVLMGLLSVSFWRMKNWTRLFLLAVALLSLVGSFQALVAAAGAGSLSGSALHPCALPLAREGVRCQADRAVI